ncbi:hypothetical protein [Nakamurella deserti]|uniref:hypothetical protein n=1 Tax=Nakamurella deserti TaxID=2164074 RepID=UPI000DBE3821|nr:hypothetical protein [Nakamurella deserti]
MTDEHRGDDDATTGTASAGLATGSDAGAPGEDSAPPPQDGDDAALAALRGSGGTPVESVEDDPEMAAAAREDRVTGLLAGSGGTDADTPDFREPGAG